MNLVTYTCEQCETQFERKRKKQGYRCCGPNCANARRVKLTPENLRPYAERGARIKVIAYELGVAWTSVRRGLNRYGLHRLWATRRYRKCAVAA